MKKRIVPVLLALSLLVAQLSPLTVFAQDSSPANSSSGTEAPDTSENTPSAMPDKSELALEEQVSSKQTVSDTSNATVPQDAASSKEEDASTPQEQPTPQTQNQDIDENTILEDTTTNSLAEPININGIYQITTAEELAWFRDTVNQGANTIQAVLCNDIDLDTAEWTPIGGGDGFATTFFAGVFDGAGHTISGLSINAGYNHAGLFGYVNGAGAVIKNLSVQGNITSSSANVGGIVGTLVSGTVQNCSFNGSVTNNKAKNGYAGGIVGYFNNSSTANTPAVIGCVNKANVSSNGYAGGITGYGKYGTISESYNTGTISGTTRAGGIAGQLQNNFVASYCYNIGTVSGSATTGEITDFLFTSASLVHCGYTTTLYGAGAGAGTSTDCFVFTNPADLLAGLGDAYKANGEGYPVLLWENSSSSEAPVLNPSISLQGANTIFVEKGVSPNQTTLSLALQDIKEESITDIQWNTSLIKGSPSLEEIVSISHPENNNTALIIAALSGGGTLEITINVSVGETVYTTSKQISVIPQITFASVVNKNEEHGTNPVLGEIATVKVTTLGGDLYDFENYPELTFNWKYNAPNATSIASTTNREYLLPNDGSLTAGNYMYVEICNSEGKVLRNAADTRGLLAAEPTLPAPEPEPSPEEEYLEQAISALGEWYSPINPVYGSDENIIDIVQADLAKKGFEGIAISINSLEELYAGGTLAQDGALGYFYADPNNQNALWMAQYKVALTLAKDDATKEIQNLVVNVPWNQDKVKNVMKEEILPSVSEQVILGTNDKDNIVSDLVLPKIAGNKKWALIEWTSSDPSVISINNTAQGTSETFYEPYIGKIIRGEKAKTVTLTAKFNFQLTSLGEPDIALYKTFTFTIPPLSSEEADAIRSQLLQKIDAGVEGAGFTDYVTGEKLVAQNGVYTISNDIQYPTTKDFTVDGKYFPVTINSSNSEVIEGTAVANAARSFVYRPLPGNAAESVTVTISITDTAKGISASRDYEFIVQPLTQGELDSALALMAATKENYFKGINNNTYSDYYSVTGKLSPFKQVDWASSQENANLAWTYSNDTMARGGVIADEIDGWADQEAWRTFRSSEPAVIDHETLNYTQPSEDTFVQISSSLTHQVLGKYWEKFKDTTGYEMFETLYRQPVQKVIMVQGQNHVARTAQELEDLRNQAIAKINQPLSATMILANFAGQQATQTFSLPQTRAASGQLINTTITDITAGTTVFGLFRQVMEDNHYTYSAVGSYIRSITDANGNTLAERDGGPNSGWIYIVNGKMPMVYMNGYTLKQGDVVEIKYTKDYLTEPGGTLPTNPEDPTTPDEPTTSAQNSTAEKPASTTNSTTGNNTSGTGSKAENGTSKSNAATKSTSSSDSTNSASKDSQAASKQTTSNEEASSGVSSNVLDENYIAENVEQNKDSNSTILIIVLVIVVVAFVIISAIIYSKKNKKK